MQNNPALTEDEKVVLAQLEMTPEKAERKKNALEKVNQDLHAWLAKPLSGFRYQTPDEQFENDSDALVVAVEVVE